MHQKQRIVIVAPGHSVFIEPWVHALSRIGFECRVFDFREGSVFTSPIVRAVLNRFPFLRFLKRRRVRAVNRNLLSLIRAWHPRYMLCQKADNITPATILAVRAEGVIALNIYNDFINQWEHIRRLAPHYDFFFSADHYVLQQLEREGIRSGHYLPFAVDAESPRTVDSRIRYDVAFIGTYNPGAYSSREKFLTAIKDFDLHIWGSPQWKSTALRGNYEGRAKYEDRLDIYAASKIVVDINWDNMPCEAVNLRPFEIGFAGACLFSDTTRADLSRIFEPFVDFVPFSDEHDLRKKIRYYLENEDERITIARSCHKKVMSRHTYDVRMREMLAIVGAPLQATSDNGRNAIYHDYELP